MPIATHTQGMTKLTAKLIANECLRLSCRGKSENIIWSGESVMSLIPRARRNNFGAAAQSALANPVKPGRHQGGNMKHDK
jgi:hypothetical protein